MDPVTLLSVSVPYMLKAIGWAFELAPDAATAAQSIAAAAESGASLVELVTTAKSAFAAKPRQGVLLRRCVLITGLAVRAAREVAPPTTKANDAALEAGVKLAWDVCAATVPDPEDEAALGNALNDWLAPPLSTPWGRALWDVLARRQIKKRGPTLASAEERRAFERRFMAAWSLNTSTGEGEEIERAVLGLRELDATQLREQLVAELATWGGRHVFGNLRAGAELQGIPWMSLEAVYVEPEVIGRFLSGSALKTLWKTVQARPLTLVTADMGLGKTLTARMFVRERALDWLEAKDTPGERWMPIYVRCADEMRAGRTELEDLVAGAWMRQWEERSGKKLRTRDERLGLPRNGARLLIVLDGLDEVNLSHEEVQHLFQKLHDEECCETLRVVVFSRPGALPSAGSFPESMASLTVQPFDEPRVNEWLGRWEKLGQTGPSSMRAVQEPTIQSLLPTPVLLFMLAWTWHYDNGQLPGKAKLYERFLRKVAHGKADHDRERHPVIYNASLDALARLKSAGHLPKEAAPEDAMLWILGRVALEVHRREQLPNPGGYKRRDVENLLNDALKLGGDSDALGLISLACVLAMQADLRKDQPVLMFGHRSFQEFLVAWAWLTQLRRVAAERGEREREEEEEVIENLLIQGPEDKTIDFLLELLQSEGAPQRALLRDWARGMVHDLRVGPLTGKGAERRAAHTDTRAPLALAAFAIGGTLSGEERFVVQGPLALRRVLSWAWLTQTTASLIAPRVALGEEQRWNLNRTDLSGANLSGAGLSGAGLSGADLSETNLRGADLAVADLADANLRGADLADADLSGADLTEANLSDADLSGANLRGADLSGADLADANLRGADLSGADLRSANLLEVDLRGADLSGADLADVDLSDADLSGANLSDADLRGADLSGADLSEADLSDADLSHSSLHGIDLSAAKHLPTAKLRNARFTLDHPYLPDTNWPPDFPAEAAIAAGALPNLPLQEAWCDPTQEPPPPTEDGDP